MGILDLLMPYKAATTGLGPNRPAQNPFTGWVDSNRNYLANIGAGLAQGTGDNLWSALGSGLAAGARTMPQAVQADLSQQQQEKQKNDTIQWLHENGFDDLVPIAAAGDGAAALAEAMRRKQPGYGERVVNPGDTVLGPNNKVVYQAPPSASASDVPSGIQEYNLYTQQTKAAGGKPISYLEFKQQASSLGGSALSPESLDLIATQYLAGDKTVVTGFARNPMVRAQIANAIAEKASALGMDGKAVAAELSAYTGNVAAQKAAGTRAAQVGMAASEANQMATLALEASKNVPRGNFVPWNRAVQMYQQGTSDPNLARMVAATTSLVNAYARAVSPVGQPTDAQRAHAEEMLNNAQSPEAYAAVIDQMKKEMVAALNAPAEISENLKNSLTGGDDLSGVGAGQTYTYNPATGELE